MTIFRLNHPVAVALVCMMRVAVKLFRVCILKNQQFEFGTPEDENSSGENASRRQRDQKLIGLLDGGVCWADRINRRNVVPIVDDGDQRGVSIPTCQLFLATNFRGRSLSSNGLTGTWENSDAQHGIVHRENFHSSVN